MGGYVLGMSNASDPRGISMIWGNPTKSRDEKLERKRKLVAHSNTVLLEWHQVFTWRKAKLLDGRFACFSFVERKFLPHEDLGVRGPSYSKGDIYNGHLDILDCPTRSDGKGNVSLGLFVYRAVGQSDDIVAVNEPYSPTSPSYARQNYEEFEAKRHARAAAPLRAAADAISSPNNGRRAAVLAQKARAQGSAK